MRLFVEARILERGILRKHFCSGRALNSLIYSIHGEISAINNCTAIFTEKGMSASEIYAAWGDLSLYTNAESCPMVIKFSLMFFESV